MDAWKIDDHRPSITQLQYLTLNIMIKYYILL